MPEKRNLKRRSFAYYMQVVDNITGQNIGYLADISSRGFRLDCKQAIQPGQEYQLRMDLSDDVSHKAFIVVSAYSKYSRLDDLDPFVYNIGFQISEISSEDAEIYQRLVEKYGSGQ